jgi:methionyl-tRNA formyltransferase
LDRNIRGLSPHPGAWFEAKGERIKVLLAEPVSGAGVPGEMLADRAIACGEGALKLITLQRGGRAAVDADPFWRGFSLKPGETLT